MAIFRLSRPLGRGGGYFLNFYLLLLIWISLPIPPTQEQNIGAAIAEKKELAKFTLWEFGEMVRKKKEIGNDQTKRLGIIEIGKIETINVYPFFVIWEIQVFA